MYVRIHIWIKGKWEGEEERMDSLLCRLCLAIVARHVGMNYK